MALSNYPHLFDELGNNFDRTLQLYTQRKSSSALPQNYRFTAEEMILWMMVEFDLIDRSNLYHIHVQSSPSDTWTINHNLNRAIIARVKDASGNTLIGNVTDSSNNQAIIFFNVAVSGQAIIH